ncbi:MAG: dipeptidase [Chlamydiae bacterium]|nr:dipeptidase [Chlamydiota bacterium]MBI3266470.1 dipeptidase [Chlamydiota bacterium]
MQQVLSYIQKHQNDFLNNLNECLRIPSISVSPSHVSDVARCADFLAQRLKEMGMKRVEIFPTKRHPIVYAEWLEAPGHPTVLVYGHYDVQPVDPLNEWVKPPFEPDIRGGRLYARGSVDDKGQVYIHLSALEAYFRTWGRLPLNVKVLIEGEEEIGSPSLKNFLKEQKNLLKADEVIISDTPMLDREVPSICYGLRGLCYMEIHVSGSSQDLHSGMWGGTVENPVHVLAGILSKLKDKNGRILIPGFYKDVYPLSKTERRMLARLPASEKKLLKVTGSLKFTGEKGFSTLERMWARPTLDVNGIFGGFSGEGSKTIIPAKVGAKVSMRLVPDQDPDKIASAFKKHVEKISPLTVNVKVIKHHGSRAFLERLNHPIFEVAKRALEKAFGKKAHFIREGGSIPFVRTISDILKKPCVLLGFGLPDENAHAPNERLDLVNFFKGIEGMAYFYGDLAKWKV